MTEWEKVTLGECVSTLGDGLHGTPQYTIGGEYAFINGNNLSDGKIVIKPDTKRVNHDEYERYKKPLNERTILVSINGTLGNVGVYNGEKVILGKSACYFNVNEAYDRDFMRYVVASPDFQQYLQSNATGTTIKNISLKQMKEYSFRIPSLQEQKKIACILKNIDDKIAINDRINHNLADQIQAIYCNDYDPIAHTPSGFLHDICHYSTDKVPVSELSISTYYSTENMQPNKAGAVDATGLPSISQATKCHKGDVLVSNIRPYFKKIVYATNDCGCSTDVLCFSPKESKLSAFLFGTLYIDRFFDYMVAGSKGTKMPRGDKQQIMNYPIVIPSEELLTTYNETIIPMLTQIACNHAENKWLTDLRNTLLPKLMSGEIVIPEINH